MVSNLTLTTLSNTISGAVLETWVVPPNPVTLQNKSLVKKGSNVKYINYEIAAYDGVKLKRVQIKKYLRMLKNMYNWDD